MRHGLPVSTREGATKETGYVPFRLLPTQRIGPFTRFDACVATTRVVTDQ